MIRSDSAKAGRDMAIVNTSGVMGLTEPGWSPPDECDEFRIVRLLSLLESTVTSRATQVWVERADAPRQPAETNAGSLKRLNGEPTLRIPL
jgi:hypothetical protein